jgi:predicted NodU family carbamoyl transferase
MNRMLKIFGVVAIATLVLPLLTWAADNPYKSAKVGEWVEYVTTTETMGNKHDMKTKQTVVAKDDVSVTLRIVTTMMGKEMPPHDTKIMLNQPYQPFTQADTDAKVTTLGEGDETITVDGKSYKCHWAKAKVVATKPAQMESTMKAWSSKDVPLAGMVKMESESVMTMQGTTMNTKMTMKLTGSGR